MRRDGKEIKTKHVVLTFDRSSLPQAINAALFIRCQVSPYVLNTRRCFKCERYEHDTNPCRGSLACGKWAQHGHPTKSCTINTFKCSNCENPHPAYSRSSEVFKNKKKIMHFKFTENINFPEARKKPAMFSP